MNLFSNTRTKRRTVFAILVVWAFALSAGWANACVLQERGAHAHGQATSTSTAHQAPVVSAGHRGADSDHDETSGVAVGACLKVCDDNTQAIVKLASGVDLIDAAMAPPAAFIGFDSLGTAALGDAFLESPAPRAGVPLRIQFARLAL